MAAKTYSGKKPENMKKTVGYFLSYMGRHKRMLFVVAVLVSVSALCNLLGTYMIRPVVRRGFLLQVRWRHGDIPRPW